MKKILLATTMLAGTAGFAAAEIAVTGSAEIGVWSNSAGDVAFWQDVEVNFAGSGTTDGGLEFGAQIDLDEGGDDGSIDPNAEGTTVWVSGAFGKLTMGDTDGALDWAVQDAGALTSLADDHTTHVAYFHANGYDSTGWGADGDNQVVRYENTFGAFGAAISLEQGDNGIGAVGVEDKWGVGLKYSPELGGTTMNLGLGYQKAGDDSIVGVSVGADLAAGFSGSIGYITGDVVDGAPGGEEQDRLGVGLTYTTGALALHANWGDIDSSINANDADSYGVAVNYDLGGGAKVEFGYASDVVAGTPGDQDQWSLGLGLSF